MTSLARHRHTDHIGAGVLHLCPVVLAASCFLNFWANIILVARWTNILQMINELCILAVVAARGTDTCAPAHLRAVTRRSHSGPHSVHANPLLHPSSHDHTCHPSATSHLGFASHLDFFRPVALSTLSAPPCSAWPWCSLSSACRSSRRRRRRIRPSARVRVPALPARMLLHRPPRIKVA